MEMEDFHFLIEYAYYIFHFVFVLFFGFLI